MRIKLVLFALLFFCSLAEAQTFSGVASVDEVDVGSLAAGYVDISCTSFYGGYLHGGQSAYTALSVAIGDVVWWNCDRYPIISVAGANTESTLVVRVTVAPGQMVPEPAYRAVFLREPPNKSPAMPLFTVSGNIGIAPDIWGCIVNYYAEHPADVQVSARLSGNGHSTPLDIAQMDAQNGEVLTWKADTWEPEPPDTTSLRRYGTDSCHIIFPYPGRVQIRSSGPGLGTHLFDQTAEETVFYATSAGGQENRLILLPTAITSRAPLSYEYNNAGLFSANSLVSKTYTDSLHAAQSGGGFTPATLNAGSITADLNNWSPAGYTTATRHLLVQPGSSSVALTGLVKLAAGAVSIVLENTGAYMLLLYHEDAASVAANRFSLETAVVGLWPKRKITIVYDEVAGRWKIASLTGFAVLPKTVNAFEYITTLNATGLTNIEGFSATSGGGTLGTVSANSAFSHATVSFTTSVSATGRYVLNSLGAVYFSTGGEAAIWKARVQANTAAPDATDDYLIMSGFTNTSDFSAPARFAGFIAGRAGATFVGGTLSTTNWHCVLYDGAGSAQIFDTGIAPAYNTTVNASGLQTLEVAWSKFGARFYIDDTLQTTLSTEININNSVLGVTGIKKMAGTTPRSIVITSAQIAYYDNL